MELENRMVSAEWLKNKYYEICEECNSSVIFIDRIIDEIDDAPDVEVVRCKDCKYYRHGTSCVCELHSEEPDQYGRGFEMQMLPNDFCPYGERKDNG